MYIHSKNFDIRSEVYIEVLDSLHISLAWIARLFIGNIYEY